ncbi:hypothetical protein AB0I10_41195, partial [Streptomyces sp. NPDC050636]|uniref:hypothetical protein n=1 Tax=Streptomyces sp. NPDC050636 TaxID=3154510 RepID=UPI00342FB08B
YRPEWTLHHLPEGRTPGQFHAADDRFWSGEGQDTKRTRGRAGQAPPGRLRGCGGAEPPAQ